MMPIPVVFAFDDAYALPASVAIKSLLDAKSPDTQYKIIVFHGGLKSQTMRKMETIAPIRWIKVDDRIFSNMPTSVMWPKEVYYRLLLADLLPEYDKVIWSDVDVLFQGDLSHIYHLDLDGAEWAGVPAEKAGETNGVHTHFMENKKPFVYMSGFMVADTKKWRAEHFADRCFETIKVYRNRLKMFDLDVLNLTAKNIKAIPFEYCVLENIYHNADIAFAPEFPWLKNTFGEKVLQNAQANPVIIHYAGKNPKIWLRKSGEIPQYYWNYIKHSPFYCADNYSWSYQNIIKLLFLRLIKPMIFNKSLRKKVKLEIKHLQCLKGNSPIKSTLYRENTICDSAKLAYLENIKFGGKVYVGVNCRIFAEGGLTIGAYTKIGEDCLILTTNHNYKSTRVPYDHIGISRPVSIGKNVWIGARSIILAGVKIEDGAIVGAGSVLTKSVPYCAIVAGNPAKIIGYRNIQEYERLEKGGFSYPQDHEPPTEFIQCTDFHNFMK